MVTIDDQTHVALHCHTVLRIPVLPKRIEPLRHLGTTTAEIRHPSPSTEDTRLRDENIQKR